MYYHDPYIKSFSTEVVEQRKENGETYLILKETAFYPTGGGQPHDTGLINGIKVKNVEEVDGEIRHYLEQSLSKDIVKVDCELDWERRQDHMQQHSGQHILSAAFEEIYGYRTVSFHLGKETSTIDLDIEELPSMEVLKVEEKANQIVMEARKIETIWVKPEELSQYRLRKEVSVTENIRLVIIPDYDYNGCGGTHPRTTAETGFIKILGWERQRKKIRVEFICGNRVLAQLQKKHSILHSMTGCLNAPEEDLLSAVDRLLDRNKALNQLLDESKDTILQYEAKDLIKYDSEGCITAVFQNRTIKELQKLARLATQLAETKVIVLIAENDSQLQLVCARGQKAQQNMRDLLNELLPLINGKGGGSPSFAQGGGESLVRGEQLVRFIKDKYNVS
nr:DHHA1 domain-containing protein [Mesobacillus maritimus]